MPSYAQTQSVQTTRTIQFEYWDVRKQHGMKDITKAAKKNRPKWSERHGAKFGK